MNSFKTFYEAIQVKFYIKSSSQNAEQHTYSTYFGNLLL
jgi:hypothetical protein